MRTKSIKKGKLILGISMMVMLTGCRQRDYETQVETGFETSSRETKQDIVFAMQWMDEATERAIVKFNKENEMYRIVADTCTAMEYEEDYRRKIDMAMAAGTGADLFLLPAESYETYLEKGLLFDLAPFFEADQELDRGDYEEAVLNCYTKGDGLYAMPTSFTLTAMSMPADIWEEIGPKGEMGWTVEEMMNAVKEMPKVKELITAYSREEVLEYCCLQTLATGKSFEEKELIDILEFTNQYGCSPERMSSLDTSQWYYMPEREKNLLMAISLNRLDYICRARALWNNDVALIGFPSEDRGGVYLYPLNAIAIRSDSPHAEAAWEFIKILISEEWQAQGYSYPVLKNALQDQLNEVAENIDLEEDAGAIMVGDIYLEVMAPTKRDVELFQKLLADSVPYPAGTEELCGILMEEASAYFAGDKSAQEAAKIILNRMELYRAERE